MTSEDYYGSSFEWLESLKINETGREEGERQAFFYLVKLSSFFALG